VYRRSREQHQQLAYKYVTGAINSFDLCQSVAANIVTDRTVPHPKVRNIPQSFPQISDGDFRTSAVLHFRILGIPFADTASDVRYVSEALVHELR